MAAATQAELEKQAYGYGRERAADRIAKIEQQGQAADNPYAQAVYRKFVLPLSATIGAEQEAVRGRGRWAWLGWIRFTPWRSRLWRGT